MNSDAVIVFAKNPVPGKVKTRLGAEIGDTAAANLYCAFLIDTLEKCGRLDATVRLYLTPTDDPIEDDLARFDEKALRQRGLGLGERMMHAIQDTFDEGFDRVVIIGSDHPTLPLSRIEQAFEAVLQPHTVAIGPTYDGGYYLLGLSRPEASLFDQMTYSHEKVFDQTVARARLAGLRVWVLDPWYDVDTIDDIRKLSLDLRSDESGYPNTRSTLSRTGLMEN